MKLTKYLAYLAMLSVTNAIVLPREANPDDATAIVRSMKTPRDPNNFLHLGNDGVLRSINLDRGVREVRQMPQKAIKQMVEVYGERFGAEELKNLVHTFWGVDGKNVTDVNALVHPGKDIFPEAIWQEFKRGRETGQTRTDDIPRRHRSPLENRQVEGCAHTSCLPTLPQECYDYPPCSNCIFFHNYFGTCY